MRLNRTGLGLVALAVLTLLRLALAARLPLAPDEAYYFLWSRHLQAGYFDHPPMVALWIRAGTGGGGRARGFGGGGGCFFPRPAAPGWRRRRC